MGTALKVQVKHPVKNRGWYLVDKELGAKPSARTRGYEEKLRRVTTGVTSKGRLG